jgi:hypothetical protein
MNESNYPAGYNADGEYTGSADPSYDVADLYDND